MCTCVSARALVSLQTTDAIDNTPTHLLRWPPPSERFSHVHILLVFTGLTLPSSEVLVQQTCRLVKSGFSQPLKIMIYLFSKNVADLCRKGGSTWESIVLHIVK